MDNTTNNQGYPGQNPGQNPDQQPVQNPNQYQGQDPNQFQGQNPGQYQGQPNYQNTNQGGINPETGKTYWESQNAGQNPSGQQGVSTPDTPAQFYQNYQQQMGANSYSAPQPQMQSQLPQRKSRKKLVVSLAAVVFILAIVGTAFAFKDKIFNALSLGTKSPQEYYASVEQDAINNALDKLVSSYEGFDVGKDMAYRVTADLSYDKATLDSILSGYAGITVGDLESYIGIPLDNIGADMTIAMNNSTFYDEIVLRLNNVDVITAEILMDTVNQELLMRFPELSSAYLRQSLDMAEYGMYGFDTGSYMSELEDFSPKKIIDFLKRYMTVITNSMKNVELTKDEKLTIGDTTETCNLLTVTIDDEAFLDIALAVIEEAKKDDYLIDLAKETGMTKKDYLNALDEAQREIQSDFDEFSDDAIIMEVYVNKDGKIIGRNFELIIEGDSQGSFGYGIATKGKNSEYEFFFEDSNGTRLVNITGSQTVDNGAYTGEAELEVNIEDMNSISVDIEYEDIRSEVKDNKVYNYGKVTVSSLALMGMNISLEYDVVDDIQHTIFAVGMGNTDLVSLNITTEYLNGFDFPAVDSSAEIYDVYDSYGYEATIDLDKFISGLSDKLGVDVQSIIENLFSSYYYY